MIKSRAQYNFFKQIINTDHPFAEGARSELDSSTGFIGLPEKVHKLRKRAYAPRPTRRKMENKEIVHGPV